MAMTIVERKKANDARVAAAKAAAKKGVVTKKVIKKKATKKRVPRPRPVPPVPKGLTSAQLRKKATTLGARPIVVKKKAVTKPVVVKKKIVPNIKQKPFSSLQEKINRRKKRLDDA